MNLTLEERETSILFDANHQTISVWTLDDAIIRRMTKRHGPPDNSGQAGASNVDRPVHFARPHRVGLEQACHE